MMKSHSRELISDPTLPSIAGLDLEPVDEVDHVVEPATGPGADAASGDGEAKWVLPVPVKTASQCRVSGVRGPDPLSVSSSIRPNGAGHVPAAVRRRGSLIVIEPDGTLALVPSWMAEPMAGSATLTTCPRLSVDRLVELRARIFVYASSLLRRGIGPARRRGSCVHIQPAARLVRGGSNADGVSSCAAMRACPPDRVSSDRGGRQLRCKSASRRSRDQGGRA